MTTHIYDGINVVRMMLEKDLTGRTPRTIVVEQFNQPATDVSVWVWDGSGGKKRRQEIYPQYKAKRLPQPDGVWQVISYVKDLLKHTRAVQITVPGYEADDIVAHVARTHNDVLIHSTDRDFAQLGVRGTWNPLKNVPAEQVRLFKTWVGDPSDNISGVPGFGQKAWEEADKGLLMDIVACATMNAIPSIYTPRIERLPTRPRNWLRENMPALATLWEITGFYPVVDCVRPEHIVAGVPDAPAAFALLDRFMQ